jgi:hypothetical protein
MPILIDYSQFILSSIFTSMEEGINKKEAVSLDIVRHIFLNTIRSNKQKFKKEYGDLVICCDSANPWRNEAFPYYKARRKKNKKESDIDWSEMYKSIETLRLELVEFMPYKVLKVDNCEADDIIGAICHNYGSELVSDHDKFLILSRDKDFKQLLIYNNVQQYDQRNKKYMSVDDPELFLKEMILRGDSDDDIPNVLSEDSVFVTEGKRQTPMTQKRIDLLLNEPITDNELKRRYERNKLLIDLSMIPSDKKKSIIDQYENYNTNGRSMMMKYFYEKGLKHLTEDLGDF